MCCSISSLFAMIFTIPEVPAFAFETRLYGLPPSERALTLVMHSAAISATVIYPYKIKQWIEWHTFWYNFWDTRNTSPIFTRHSLLVNTLLVLASIRYFSFLDNVENSGGDSLIVSRTRICFSDSINNNVLLLQQSSNILLLTQYSLVPRVFCLDWFDRRNIWIKGETFHITLVQLGYGKGCIVSSCGMYDRRKLNLLKKMPLYFSGKLLFISGSMRKNFSSRLFMRWFSSTSYMCAFYSLRACTRWGKNSSTVPDTGSHSSWFLNSSLDPYSSSSSFHLSPSVITTLIKSIHTTFIP